MIKRINIPFDRETIESLKCGETVLISGEIYTARDCAHKKIVNEIKDGKTPPFNFDGAVVYYAGPCPAPDNLPVGSCGPTTSARMDAYSPFLIEKGLKFMIGKGERNEKVIDAIKNRGGLYFAAVGGAGAVYANCVKSANLIAYPELLSEAVYKFTVKDFPAVVAIDSKGNTVYK